MTNTNNNLEQTDIFSLFGIKDEHAEKLQKEEEERLKRQAEVAKQMEEAKKNTSAPTSKKDEFEVNAETTIYFYTEVIDINDYFTSEELENGLEKKKDGEIVYAKITENDVKNRLKKDLPVIEAGAQLVYMKKKNIVSIVLQAKKKGNNEGSHMDSSFSNRRIPFEILKEFISISQYFSEKYGTEVHGDIYLKKDTNKFVLDIPKQQAHQLWVEVTESPLETAEKVLEGNYIKCMEIHSHHSMSPFPSSQDDESERAPILYAIVGRIDKFFPEITVRTFDINNDQHIKLDAAKIFEYPFSSVSTNYDLNVVEVVK